MKHPLTSDINLFTILIDGAEQPRTNANGTAAYRLQGSYCGAGKRDLRYDWSGMTAGQHYLQVIFNGDGLNLQASRLVRVTLYGVTDTDGDGLPDTWENSHALDANDSTGDNGANGDPDYDGFTNLQEYLAGTDPQDTNSLLRITALAPGGQTISWSSVPGRNYILYAAPGAADEFTPISNPMTALSASTTFTNALPMSTNQFYRVQVFP